MANRTIRPELVLTLILGAQFSRLQEGQSTSTNPSEQRGVQEVQLPKEFCCSIWGQAVILDGLDDQLRHFQKPGWLSFDYQESGTLQSLHVEHHS